MNYYHLNPVAIDISTSPKWQELKTRPLPFSYLIASVAGIYSGVALLGAIGECGPSLPAARNDARPKPDI
jgi:hypothetical protein